MSKAKLSLQLSTYPEYHSLRVGTTYCYTMVSSFSSEPFDEVLIPCSRALRDPREKVKVHFGALRAHEQAVIPGLGALLLRQSAAKSRLLLAPIALRDVHFSSPRIRFVLLTLHRWSRSARRRGMSTLSKGSEQNEEFSPPA
jgi:hypothetical protein